MAKFVAKWKSKQFRAVKTIPRMPSNQNIPQQLELMRCEGWSPSLQLQIATFLNFQVNHQFTLD